jgi:hypothetical protein
MQSKSPMCTSERGQAKGSRCQSPRCGTFHSTEETVAANEIDALQKVGELEEFRDIDVDLDHCGAPAP